VVFFFSFSKNGLFGSSVWTSISLLLVVVFFSPSPFDALGRAVASRPSPRFSVRKKLSFFGGRIFFQDAILIEPSVIEFPLSSPSDVPLNPTLVPPMADVAQNLPFPGARPKGRTGNPSRTVLFYFYDLSREGTCPGLILSFLVSGPMLGVAFPPRAPPALFCLSFPPPDSEKSSLLL